eukprot:2968778-Amphidinium_carterae.1
MTCLSSAQVCRHELQHAADASDVDLVTLCWSTWREANSKRLGHMAGTQSMKCPRSDAQEDKVLGTESCPVQGWHPLQ